jgi:hypothetical protein
MLKSNSSYALPGVAGLLLSLGLAACSDDGTAETTIDTTTVSTVPTNPQHDLDVRRPSRPPPR